MSLFKSILEKLGIKKTAAETPATKGAAAGTKGVTLPPAPKAPSFGGSAPVIPGASRPAPIEVVDVVAKLEGMAKKASEPLDWKVSIVDLLKLLGLDSSLKARKELATELGCPAEYMSDSAKMNTWLHKTVLKKIAENGGNIPSSLL